MFFSHRRYFSTGCARAAEECVSSDKATVQISDELSGSLAVDDDATTHSCTDDAASNPWWAVDLGADYIVTSVTVTMPSVAGNTRNCLRARSVHIVNLLRETCQRRFIL